MASDKEAISERIRNAHLYLGEALSELKELPLADVDQIWTIAHSLNNYLTVTTASVDLIKITLAEDTREEVQRWLDGILHASVLMRKTVEQLTSKAENTELAYRLEATNLTLYLQRVAHVYRRIAGNKNIGIKVSTDDQPAFARIDLVALGVVVDNLLSNAVKYSPRGSTVRLSLIREKSHLIYNVLDEGAGISTDDQKRLFQRGVRLTAQPTAGESSNGYGLGIVKDITNRLGRSVGCMSEVGQGATFWVSFPEVPTPTSPVQ